MLMLGLKEGTRSELGDRVTGGVWDGAWGGVAGASPAAAAAVAAAAAAAAGETAEGSEYPLNRGEEDGLTTS